MNTSNKIKRKKEYYVWRMAMDAQGKLHTAATMKLAPKHSMHWVAANYDTRRRDPVDSIGFNKLMAEIDKTYFPDIQGDICIAPWESYEDCVAWWQQYHGMKIKYATIQSPIYQLKWLTLIQ